MRRRRLEVSSSLDLFLDTICNAFGGIMFISILIAVMAQMQSRQSQAVEGPTITKAQAIVLSKQIEQRQRELTKAKLQLQIIEKQIPTPEQEETKKLQDEIVNAQKNLDEVTSRQTETATKLSETQAKMASLKQEAREVERKLLEAQAEMQKRSIGADEALNAKISKVPLPNVNESKKGNILMLMRYGKLYLVSDPASSDAMDFYSDHVEFRDVNQERRVKPKPSSGWDLANAGDSQQFRNALLQRANENTFLSIAVWPDSFQSFKKFREIVIPLSYEYQLVPIDEVEELPIRKGSSASVQ